MTLLQFNQLMSMLQGIEILLIATLINLFLILLLLGLLALWHK